MSFYVNKYDSGLSRFTPPTLNPQDYQQISVSAISYDELIDLYGYPDFVKIDLEGYDKIILNYMLNKNLWPNYLQFENNGIDLLERIITTNKYDSFNIVSFYNFSKFYDFSQYRNAGPIGIDIKSPWLSGFRILEVYKDIKH